MKDIGFNDTVILDLKPVMDIIRSDKYKDFIERVIPDYNFVLVTMINNDAYKTNALLADAIYVAVYPERESPIYYTYPYNNNIDYHKEEVYKDVDKLERLASKLYIDTNKAFNSIIKNTFKLDKKGVYSELEIMRHLRDDVFILANSDTILKLDLTRYSELKGWLCN